MTNFNFSAELGTLWAHTANPNYFSNSSLIWKPLKIKVVRAIGLEPTQGCPH